MTKNEAHDWLLAQGYTVKPYAYLSRDIKARDKEGRYLMETDDAEQLMGQLMILFDGLVHMNVIPRRHRALFLGSEGSGHVVWVPDGNRTSDRYNVFVGQIANLFSITGEEHDAT